jgi:hypothetical protein
MRDMLMKKVVDVYIVIVINTDDASPEILK